MRAHAKSATLAVRTIRALAAAALVFGASACSDLLEVSDPGAIGGDQLTDPALEQLVVNGVIGEFQNAYSDYALWSGVLADEVFTDHTNVDVRQFSLHDFNDLNTTNSGVYVSIQRTRQSADDAVVRLREMLGTGAESSLNVARVLAYGGYAYVLLGEGFCDAPVNLGPPLTPDELFAEAIVRFDEAIAIATAGRTGANIAAADDLINMANVGAARAALNLGDHVKASAYASLVPDDYEMLAYYSSNSVRENNSLHRPARTADPFLGITPFFLAKDDPRAPPLGTTRLGLNSNPIRPPQLPHMFVGWIAGTLQPIEITTNIKFATGLEARYIVAEADGPTVATLAFVNERRAVGGQGIVALTGDALMDELRDQRSRDFFLTGHRLGDLRRYLEDGTDLFPSGQYPVFTDHYGDKKCFIVPLSEKAGNPNY
jgi:hypothetical protein